MELLMILHQKHIQIINQPNMTPLKHAQYLAARYGTAYLAKCRWKCLKCTCALDHLLRALNLLKRSIIIYISHLNLTK